MTGTKNKRLKTFLALSEALTGVKDLELDLSRAYLARLDAAFGTKQIDALLNRFDTKVAKADMPEQAVEQHIMKDAKLGQLGHELIILWYLAGFRAPGIDSGASPMELGPETPEQYFRGLLWPVIRAHPLGLSGGYFGYWRYPPEN